MSTQTGGVEMTSAWQAQLLFLLHGLMVTLELTVLSCALALPISFIAGYARSSPIGFAKVISACYVELFRGTSSLVQMFWFFYVLPLLGLRMPALMVGVLVLGLNAGSYGSEIVRGAIAAVPREQREAAQALNMTSSQIMLRVILPQAIPAMLPPFGNLLIELLKNTSLVSLITISELTFSAEVLRAESLHTVQLFGLILLLYYAVASVIAAGLHRLEFKFAKMRSG
jgi:polar amino acid transport system permease protein